MTAVPPQQVTATRRVTREAIRLYAEASGDFNPIHVDEAFAATTPFGGIIAHGMMIVAYASEMMGQEFSRKWLSGGIMRVRFRNPARPGDVLTITAERQDDEVISGKRYLRYSLTCHNDKQVTVIDGQVLVAV
ncbi:MAG: MaoC family dehydratase [Dehalococcoidia bacterium]|nr:MaoC family dehydratase [Dehalococcoidia bacterium]